MSGIVGLKLDSVTNSSTQYTHGSQALMILLLTSRQCELTSHHAGGSHMQCMCNGFFHWYAGQQ